MEKSKNQKQNNEETLMDQILQQGGFDQRQTDIVSWAKKYFENKSCEFRDTCAINHIKDALSYRYLRVYRQASQNQSKYYFICTQLCYEIQTSPKWRQFLLTISYFFMYLISISHLRPVFQQIYIETSILILFWIDICLQTIHRYYSTHRIIGFKSLRNCAKFLIVSLLTFDQVYSIAAEDLKFRPFIILRVVMPVFFGASLRKKIVCIFRLYKDFIAYIIVYSIALACFAIVTTQFIQLPQQQQLDNFTENYRSLSQTMVLYYVLSSYDSYPDNQLKPIRHQHQIYTIFIIFIFINVLIFTTVPNTFLFQAYKKNYARQILIEEIQQQHSLVFAFIALSNKEMKVPMNKFIKSLFTLYRNNFKYVGYIASICMKLNHHSSNQIEMAQFIELSKILHADKTMLPPTFIEVKIWNRFRNFINTTLKFKEIAGQTSFQIIISIFTTLSILNACLFFYHQNLKNICFALDFTFTFIFLVQIIIKIIGLGIQNFFRSSLNTYDFFIINFMLFEQIFSFGVFNDKQRLIIKLLRFYRIFTLGKQVATSINYFKGTLYLKIYVFINQFMTIFPIIRQFLPIFAMTSYCLGVFGLFLFRQKPSISAQESSYSKYDQFSNFRAFLNSQFIIIQILVQAGWSSVMFDHAYRYANAFMVTAYFLFCHLLIVFVLTPLLKGIIWGVYQTINEERTTRNTQLLKKDIILKRHQRTKNQLLIMSKQILQKKTLCSNTILQRILIQKRSDEIILQKLKSYYRTQNINKKFEDKDKNNNNNIINQNQLFKESMKQNSYFQNIEDLLKQDIQQFQNQLSKKMQIQLHSYQGQVCCPFILVSYLQKRLKTASQEFYVDEDNKIVWNQQSIRIIKNQLNYLLQIKNNFKHSLVKNIYLALHENGLTFRKEQLRINRKQRQLQILNKNYVIRQTFLKEKSQRSIKTIEFELLRDMYGNHIDQITGNLSIQKLLIYDSRFVYSLRNLLRYPQISCKQFFNLLVNLENYMTTKVLKKGSLFKFIFKLAGQNIWFALEVQSNKQVYIKFLKGNWIWNEKIQDEKILFCKDFFYCDQHFSKKEKLLGRSLMKMIFKQCENLSLTLPSKQRFFAYEPSERIYDTFILCSKNNKDLKIQKIKKAAVQKVMVFILSNEKQRNQILSYELTNIQRSQKNELNNKRSFKIDQSQQQTLSKLQNKEEVKDEHIQDYQGISFVFLINLLTEIQDILQLYGDNLFQQLQKLLQYSI